MNWSNLFWIFCFAAHTAAGIFYLVLGMVLYGIDQSGFLAWMVPAGCLALLVMDVRGQINLRGSGAKTLAAFGLPFLCGCAEVLFWDSYGLDHASPKVLAWVLGVLLLAVYVLLREEHIEASLDKAEALLLHGSALGVAVAVWLAAMAGAVLFMATFGLVVSLLVGGLISSKNSLLDYGGVKGALSGLLALYVLQCLLYWRGVRLARGDELEQNDNVPLITLFVPIWNRIQARRLARRLQMRGVKAHY